MTTTFSGTHHERAVPEPRAHTWEMIEEFSLSLPQDRTYVNECMLAPIAEALLPLGIEDALLCEISAAVEQASEDLRCDCLDGRLDCVRVRVQASSAALRAAAKPQAVSQPGAVSAPWRFSLIKQIASGEPYVIEEPFCVIDIYVFRGE